MSYILDALKKSEQQRQRSKGPSLDALTIAPYSEKSNSYLLYGLICVAVLALMLATYLLRPWQHSNKVGQVVATAPAVAEQPDQPLVAATPQPEVVAPMKLASLEPVKKTLPVPQIIKPSVKTTKQLARETLANAEKVIKPDANPHIENKAIHKETPEPQVISATSPAIEKMPPAEEAPIAVNHVAENVPLNKLYEMPELPPGIQQDIPDMSIAGYAFSENPKERSVGINGRLLQEGDYLKQGLRLEHISPEGLVFSYKNYHFRQSLQ